MQCDNLTFLTFKIFQGLNNSLANIQFLMIKFGRDSLSSIKCMENERGRGVGRDGGTCGYP